VPQCPIAGDATGAVNKNQCDIGVEFYDGSYCKDVLVKFCKLFFYMAFV